MWNWIGDSSTPLPEPDAPETFDAFFRRASTSPSSAWPSCCRDRGRTPKTSPRTPSSPRTRRWPEISTFDSPEAWVRRVVANLSASWVRRKWREAPAHWHLGVTIVNTPAPTLVDAEQHTFWSTVGIAPTAPGAVRRALLLRGPLGAGDRGDSRAQREHGEGAPPQRPGHPGREAGRTTRSPPMSVDTQARDATAALKRSLVGVRVPDTGLLVRHDRRRRTFRVATLVTRRRPERRCRARHQLRPLRRRIPAVNMNVPAHDGVRSAEHGRSGKVRPTYPRHWERP